jgi:peptide-methionine (S)-S-oxide reductase
MLSVSKRSVGRFAKAGLIVIPAAFALYSAAALSDEAPVKVPAPAADATSAADGSETAVLAGGCFWGMQAVFEHVKGVKEVIDGYAGGANPNPSYEEVSSGDTGHAESVKITFDPHQVSYGTLLRVYFSVAHDPTELDRQGPDTGTQYRSAVFPTNAEQARVAKAYIAQLGSAGVFHEPIVTKITPGATFFPAEGYHQDYYLTHPDSMYIVINDAPKVEHLKQLFPELYRDEPVRVADAQ